MTELRPLLLVEDNWRDVELTVVALAKTSLANEIVAALDYVYRQNRYADREPGDPAVILLDLKLPKVDGLEVLEKVKGDPEHHQTSSC